MRFGISFYLIAMLFILFDIEVVFLYPIAVELRAYGSYALAETITFIVLLFVAFVYVWRRGALGVEVKRERSAGRTAPASRSVRSRCACESAEREPAAARRRPRGRQPARRTWRARSSSATWKNAC